jgi:molybdopterin/thiamine biosynthesis adenylyltransferase
VKTELSIDEITRYARQLKVPELGHRGQLKLRRGSVVVVGAGGLGSPASLFLAAAGVGTLGLADFDEVELGNIQRQILYSTRDVGRPKLAAAEERLRAANPLVSVVRHETRITASNAAEILGGYDVVVDGTDNHGSRYIISDTCCSIDRPHVYGAVYGFEGRLSVFPGARGPCYRCLYPVPPPSGDIPECAEGGVIGPVPGAVGSLQAVEAVKLIAGTGSPLFGRLAVIDTFAMRFRVLAIDRRPDCPSCRD